MHEHTEVTDTSANAQALLKRFAQAERRVDGWRGLLTDVFRYCLPQYSPFARDGQGARRARDIYDATAPEAYMDLAGDLQFGLTPPNEPWVRFDIEPRSKARLQLSRAEVLSLQTVLDEQADTLFEFVRRSNFDTEVHCAYLNLIASTGALLVQENDDPADPLRFQSVPIGELVPELGPFGTIETVFRRFNAPARTLQLMWPDARWSDRTAATIRDEPDREVELVEATMKRTDAARGWDYVVVEYDQPHVALEDRFAVSPWVVFRWSVAPGELLGRGPAVAALADVKTLNKAVELTLKNATWAIVGAYQAEDYGVTNLNTLNLQPGLIIPIEPGTSGIRPIERSGDFAIAQEIIFDLRRAVRETFLRVTLPPPDGAAKSATEIATRADEALRRIGPPFARVYAELMLPLVRRIRHILRRAGVLEPIDLLAEEDIKIVPVSPLAQAASRARVADALQTLGAVAALDPASTQRIVDMEETVEWALVEGRFPAHLLRTAEEREQERAAQAALQAVQGTT